MRESSWKLIVLAAAQKAVSLFHTLDLPLSDVPHCVRFATSRADDIAALFIGPYVIQKLREFQIGQFVREDGPHRI